jgi:hypothetical protein
MIIGLHGSDHSGKESAAKILIEKYGFKRFACADKLQRICNLLQEELGVTKEVDATTEWGASLGKLGRSLEKDVWIKPLGKLYEEDPEANIVVTDVCYLNEAKYITERGGLIIKIDRPDKTPANAEEALSDRVLSLALDYYVGEQTVIINNDGSLEDLEAKIEVAVLSREKTPE